MHRAEAAQPAPVTPPPDPPEGRPPEAEPALSAPIQVEGLILGHLPVLGPAWAAQFVRRSAELDARPLAFARLQGDTLSIDLIGVSGARRAEASDALDGAPRAIERAAAITGRWILRVDELDEPRLMHARGIDLITLLTGADEAAVVAAYRTLKRLALAEDPGAAIKAKRLRVAIVGRTWAPRLVADKLAGAPAFLGRSIELGHHRRIQSGHPITLHRGTDLQSAARSLIRKAPRPAPTPASQPPAHPPARPVAAPTPFPEPLGPIPDLATNVATVQRMEAAPPATPPARSHADDQSLARHITSLTALPARCPFARDVELAIDVVGRAHVLVRALDDEPDAAVRDATHRRRVAHRARRAGRPHRAPPASKLETARPPIRRLHPAVKALGMLAPACACTSSPLRNGRRTGIELG
jgi:hypothetical protein